MTVKMPHLKIVDMSLKFT